MVVSSRVSAITYSKVRMALYCDVDSTVRAVVHWAVYPTIHSSVYEVAGAAVGPAVDEEVNLAVDLVAASPEVTGDRMGDL